MHFSAAVILPLLAATSYAQFPSDLGGIESIASVIGIPTGLGAASSFLASVTKDPAALSSIAAIGSSLVTAIPTDNSAINSAISQLPTSQQAALSSVRAAASVEGSSGEGNSAGALSVPGYGVGMAGLAVAGIFGAAVLL